MFGVLFVLFLPIGLLERLIKENWRKLFNAQMASNNEQMAAEREKKKFEMKMSSMEEECLLEKRRIVTLKECSEILQREAPLRYSKDVFKKLVQDEVFSNVYLILIMLFIMHLLNINFLFHI